MAPLRLLIRADASAAMGFGHIARCLAIAEAVRARGGEVTFATRDGASSVRAPGWETGWDVSRLPGEPDAPVDTAEASELALLSRCRKADCVLVDHFGADDAYLQRLSCEGVKRLALIEDGMGRRGAGVDVLLNFNLGAGAKGYLARRLLLGPGFLPLREAIALRREESLARDRSLLRRVLVVFGGSDAFGLTARAARELDSLLPPETIVRVVVGPAASVRPQLFDLSARVESIGPLSAEALAQEMFLADAAVATPSMVFWELSALGVPCALYRVAANQASARGIALRKAALVLEPDASLSGAMATLSDSSRRRLLASVASQLLDGAGAGRVAQALSED